ncbi:hypothetical protein M5K25_027195 [Dendrobium thyrsiflorum]|uniref:Uncharacterized protein n=1 Tax=Dendrobium thyrsiflorum TaxID=117978 RepID=A0ABD0TZE5_DENTH
MADPTVDHGFAYDEQGRIVVLRSPYFDPYPEWDLTIGGYLNRIRHQLAWAVEDLLPAGRWTIVGRRPPPPPPPPPSPSLRTSCAVYLGVISIIIWSSPSLDGRPSIGSSFGSVSHDSPLRPTPSHLSQPLASPDLDPASEILVEKCIRKKRSPEPETECIHFVDANDITDNEDFFDDETEAIKLGSLHDVNPDLGELEPSNFNALVNPESNPIKDIPLDKVYLNDINLISKETDLTLSTMKLNSEDSDLIITSTGLTSYNSELTLNNFEPNLEDEHPKILLESILGVTPLDLHLKECVSPDLTYLNSPCTDLNESISPYLPFASLTVVPTFVLKTLSHLLSPIPAGDSLGYPIIVMNHDPSPYRVPDSYILPSISSSFPIKDHLSPSWLALLDYTTATGRLPMTLVETSYRNALVAKDVFIAPPTPIPLNMGILCHLIL